MRLSNFCFFLIAVMLTIALKCRGACIHEQLMNEDSMFESELFVQPKILKIHEFFKNIL